MARAAESYRGARRNSEFCRGRHGAQTQFKAASQHKKHAEIRARFAAVSVASPRPFERSAPRSTWRGSRADPSAWGAWLTSCGLRLVATVLNPTPASPIKSRHAAPI